MWLLILVTLFNAVAHQTKWINHMRVPIGGFPLGIIEVLTMLLLAYAMIFGGSISREYPSRRVHPAFLFTLIFMILGLISGSIMAFVERIPLDNYLRGLKALGTWPIFLIVGYRMLGSPRSAGIFTYFLIIAGTLTATILLSNFGAQTEAIEAKDEYHGVRTVWYVDSYAGLAAMVLAISIVSGDKILPTAIALPLACYCFVGLCAPLHRIEWVAMGFCGLGILTLVPPGQRVVTALKGVGILIVLGLGSVLAVTIVNQTTQRDFGELIVNKLVSILPTERKTSKEGKAWDSRLASLYEELRLWSKNPVLGRGLAVQDALVRRGEITNWGGFHHNGWASIGAEMGITGFVGYLSLVAGMVFYGRRLTLRAPERGMRWIGAFAFMGGLFLVALVLGSMIWIARAGVFLATLGGMMYRCMDMEDAVVARMQQQYVYEEELPLHATVPGLPGGF